MSVSLIVAYFVFVFAGIFLCQLITGLDIPWTLFFMLGSGHIINFLRRWFGPGRHEGEEDLSGEDSKGQDLESWLNYSAGTEQLNKVDEFRPRKGRVGEKEKT